ncbi:hypothetical protein MNBD_ALPHA01-383 [hydrothermal vent metagenome]|uniref:ABC-type transport system involved in resistance to organic solvents, auxiliary component n=1 Tax=hydrothermal vent metagenome TaxID=652676 RepID=A0A3B0SW28_9ZZZZ
MGSKSRIKTLNPKVLVKRMFMATLSTALILIALFWSQNLQASEKKANLNEDPEIQQEAADFIQRLADEALTSLTLENATLTDQENKFRGILQKGFDVKYIGKISLGRHRKQATRENLDNYYALFPEYLVRVYTSRLTKLDTRKVNVGRVLPNGKRDMYVRTKVIDDEEKSYDVDWRVRPKKAEMEKYTYKIIDVKIEGISMARTQRDDFAARISESGMGGLIEFMQSIVNDTVMVAENDTHKEKTKASPEQTR